MSEEAKYLNEGFFFYFIFFINKCYLIKKLDFVCLFCFSNLKDFPTHSRVKSLYLLDLFILFKTASAATDGNGAENESCFPLKNNTEKKDGKKKILHGVTAFSLTALAKSVYTTDFLYNMYERHKGTCVTDNSRTMCCLGSYSNNLPPSTSNRAHSEHEEFCFQRKRKYLEFCKCAQVKIETFLNLKEREREK